MAEGDGTICGYDLDEVFCYDTVKEVKVLDRRLGIIYYLVLVMVAFYVVIYCLIYQKQYLDKEKSNGFILSRVINPSYANDTIPFDVFESITNPGESGALFIPSRVLVTRGQKQSGYCENPAYPCETAEDCTDEMMAQPPKCNRGMCVRRGWCPAEDLSAPKTEVYKVNAEQYKVWFQGKVIYHKLTTDEPIGNIHEQEPRIYPDEDANTYPMHDILRMAELSMGHVWKEGAVLLVQTVFDCDLLSAECSTTVKSATVDATTGYNYKSNVYRKEGGEIVRDSYHYYGFRLIMFATGVGDRPSFPQIVLQGSQAIALLGCAATVADMFLQYVVPERKHYIAEKIIQTEDFGD